MLSNLLADFPYRSEINTGEVKHCKETKKGID